MKSFPACCSPGLGILAGLLVLSSALHAGPPAKLPVFQTGERFAGLDEELHPLGWTKNGERLAVLRGLPNEAADERLWMIEVIDLVEDRKVLNEEIRHLDEGGFDAFWAAHGGRVEELLQPHGIMPAKFQLHRFPALLGEFRGESYEAELVRTYGIEPNFQYRGLTKLELKMTNHTGREKTAFSQEWKEWIPMAAGVVGFLPNPQGDRIAVVLGMTHRGYEAAPHIRRVILVGVRVGEKF